MRPPKARLPLVVQLWWEAATVAPTSADGHVACLEPAPAREPRETSTIHELDFSAASTAAFKRLRPWLLE